MTGSEVLFDLGCRTRVERMAMISCLRTHLLSLLHSAFRAEQMNLDSVASQRVDLVLHQCWRRQSLATDESCGALVLTQQRRDHNSYSMMIRHGWYLEAKTAGRLGSHITNDR